MKYQSEKWKWKSLSRVWLFATPRTIQSVEFSRILEYVAIPFSRGSSQTRSPALQADSLPAEPLEKPKNAGVDNLSLLQSIFPTQESKQGLLHCRQIPHQLSLREAWEDSILVKNIHRRKMVKYYKILALLIRSGELWNQWFVLWAVEIMFYSIGINYTQVELKSQLQNSCSTLYSIVKTESFSFKRE